MIATKIMNQEGAEEKEEKLSMVQQGWKFHKNILQFSQGGQYD